MTLRRFGPQSARVRAMPCAACVVLGTRQTWPTEAHHEPPRSCGGVDRDTLPLCTAHHVERHTSGVVTFWARVGVQSEHVLQLVRSGAELDLELSGRDGAPW